MSEQDWIERAQRAEALLVTQKESLGAAIDRVKDFKKNFGVREKQDGSIDIDFDKFAKNISLEASLELRKIIDAMYHISGNAGEKPRVKLNAVN